MALRIAAFAAAGLIVVLLLARAFRAEIAGSLAEMYLGSKGDAARVEISRWDSHEIDAQVVLGEPGRPSFAAQTIVLELDPDAWLPRIVAVRVSGSQLRVGFDGRHVSFGQLQALIDSFGKGPKSGWSNRFLAGPLPISVEQSHLVVETPAGLVIVAFKVRAVGAQPQSLDARILPATLRANGATIRITHGGMRGRFDGGAFNATGEISGNGTARDAGQKAGPVSVTAVAEVRGLVWHAPDFRLQSAALDVRASSGWGKLVLAAPHLALSLSDLTARETDGSWNGNGVLQASFSAAQARTGHTSFDAPHVDTHGTIRVSPQQDLVTASLSGSAGIPGPDAEALIETVPLAGGDRKIAGAFVRAAERFNFSSEGTVSFAQGKTTVALSGPLTVKAASGASLQIEAPANAPLAVLDAATVTGGASMTLAGGGLPSARLAIQNVSAARAGAGRLNADMQTRTSLTTTAFRNLTVSGAAHIAANNGVLTIVPNGCPEISLGAWLRKGRPLLTDAHARLCAPAGQPVLSASRTEWHVRAELGNVSSGIESAKAKLAGGTSSVVLDGASGALTSGVIAFGRARLVDAAPSRRFGVLTLSGRAGYSGATWRGKVFFGTAAHGAHLGTVNFNYAMPAQKGEALIEAPAIRFSPSGLAPSDISPLLAAATRADGTATFTGRVSWTARSFASRGRLDIDGLKFASPLGNAQGTHTHIDFVSLAPLETAPGTTLSIDRIDWMSPFTAIAITFQMTPQALDMGGVKATLAGGTVSVDPFAMSFAKGAKWSGTVRLSGIDLGALLDASNLANKVHLVAHVSGTLPVSVGPEGVRFTDGVIAATKPGRISIERSLWGSGATLSSSTMQDFAVQALEHFAYTSLVGHVNSQPKGRLGLLLHVQGYSDPPNQGETRVGLFDLLGGKAFDKPLPLPKGTPIDLTLDTSLNFDELLRAYREARSPSVSVP